MLLNAKECKSGVLTFGRQNGRREDGPNLRSEASVLKSASVNKENFKQTIKAGSGQLAAEAKREEYQRLMAKRKPRQPKLTGVPNLSLNHDSRQPTDSTKFSSLAL